MFSDSWIILFDSFSEFLDWFKSVITFFVQVEMKWELCRHYVVFKAHQTLNMCGYWQYLIVETKVLN